MQTGKIKTPEIRVTSSPAAGKIFTSDEHGDGSWQDLADHSVTLAKMAHQASDTILACETRMQMIHETDFVQVETMLATNYSIKE